MGFLKKIKAKLEDWRKNGKHVMCNNVHIQVNEIIFGDLDLFEIILVFTLLRYSGFRSLFLVNILKHLCSH